MENDTIHRYIYATIGIAIVAVILSIIALVKRGPKGDKGDKGDPGAGPQGNPGPAGPAGPAGIMTVQCSSGTGQDKTCHGTIPGELVVDGLTVSNDLIVGSPSNTWSRDGKLTTTGDITQAPSGIATFGQVTIKEKDGLTLENGNIEVNNGYITLVDKKELGSTLSPRNIYTNGLIVGSPTNSWSPSTFVTPFMNSMSPTDPLVIGSPSKDIDLSGYTYIKRGVDLDAPMYVHPPSGSIQSGGALQPDGKYDAPTQAPFDLKNVNITLDYLEQSRLNNTDGLVLSNANANIKAGGTVRTKRGLYIGADDSNANNWDPNGSITANGNITANAITLNATATRGMCNEAPIWMPNATPNDNAPLITAGSRVSGGKGYYVTDKENCGTFP